MAKYEWSEVFTSIEGEAKYSGWPTVYIRFAKCNFKCMGFNNPNMQEITNEVLGFNPKDFNSIHEIPLITTGCDSIYSWDTRFQHMWLKGDEQDLAQQVMEKIPTNNWGYPSGHNVILSLTGGEPTSRWKTIPTLLNTTQFNELKLVLIETNCSVPFKDQFVDELNKWCSKDSDRIIIWSNSPKLSITGEKWNQAIRPEVALKQRKVHSMEQYFKFVCSPNNRDFDEVKAAMNEYYSAGIPTDVPVYIMPEACLEEQQQEIAATVAQMCIDRGYIYCHRIQNSVFGNGVGT